MSGSLLGDAGGAYAYYTIPYSGGTQSVTVSFSPHAIYDANGFYVVFYQNGAQVGSAHGVDASSPGNLTASFQSNMTGPVLIQLGNYTPNDNISYTISP
jgi:hypothetical protein